MATGTATMDFGATPIDTASVNVTGLSGLTANSHLEAFAQSGDSTIDNDAASHRQLAESAKFSCEYVSATEMKINCHLLIGLATGTFKVHYATA